MSVVEAWRHEVVQTMTPQSPIGMVAALNDMTFIAYLTLQQHIAIQTQMCSDFRIAKFVVIHFAPLHLRRIARSHYRKRDALLARHDRGIRAVPSASHILLQKIVHAVQSASSVLRVEGYTVLRNIHAISVLAQFIGFRHSATGRICHGSNNNAAADELKERLHQELFKAACASSGEKRDRFRQEIDELPFCHICTIHAFCQSLIRENFDKLGISPTFEVLDETRHASYMNKALDEVIAKYTADGDETFCELADIFSQSRKEENLKSNLIKFYNLIEIQPDKDEFERCVAECYDSYDGSKFFEILQNYYKSFFAKANDALSQVKVRLETIAPTSKYVQSLAVASSARTLVLKRPPF